MIKKFAFLLVAYVLLFAGLMLVRAAPALPSDNLLDCSWFRFAPESGDPYPSLCGWFRDNNTSAVQELGIPSPDAIGGTAQKFTRKTCCIFEAKFWQIVESSGGLLLKFSTYTLLDEGDNLTIRIYGRDTRYGIGGWDHLWTPVQLIGGGGTWQNSGVLELTTPYPYRYYMIEAAGHVPMPIGTQGAAITGVYFAVDGSTLYLPTVVNGN
jgi:hypothetical protein